MIKCFIKKVLHDSFPVVIVVILVIIFSIPGLIENMFFGTHYYSVAVILVCIAIFVFGFITELIKYVKYVLNYCKE